MNPFTDETRDARLKVDVNGLCDTLRAPDSLRTLVMENKPASVSTGDFLLKAALDSVIDAKQSHGDYRGIQRLLGTLFGDEGAETTAKVPNGTAVDKRHLGNGKVR